MCLQRPINIAMDDSAGAPTENLSCSRSYLGFPTRALSEWAGDAKVVLRTTVRRSITAPSAGTTRPRDGSRIFTVAVAEMGRIQLPTMATAKVVIVCSMRTAESSTCHELRPALAYHRKVSRHYNTIQYNTVHGDTLQGMAGDGRSGAGNGWESGFG
ncbi:hypothetical protein O988_08713 [Pseudogymnoascus sp. VKM F-3808]|nr:hypothetical protein O988_08713 [Pseudogymnoascus sp. VKM F-3808]